MGASPPELAVDLDRAPPRRLAVGAGNAFFVAGACRDSAVGSIELEAPGATVELLGSTDSGGFWAAVCVAAQSQGSLKLSATAEIGDGRRATAELAEVVLDGERPSPPPRAGAAIAICMATFDPPRELLRAQLQSIRDQSRDDWICLISDDHSSPERFAELQAEVAGDSRFRVSRSERRLGIYRNFERALGMVPSDAEFVALSDQDDVWDEHKLRTLTERIGDARLIYSDARIVSETGEELAGTYWTGRSNNYESLGSLAIANTITGAASLFRRDLLDLTLPFPEAPGEVYHDHWLALTALASGRVEYHDQPLYSYVQHDRAALGHAVANALEPGTVKRSRTARMRARLTRRLDWRELYFEQVVRVQLLALVLQLRSAATDPAKRRVLARLCRLSDSPAAAAWLAVRSLRRLAGRTETLGLEFGLLRGILWRAGATRHRRRP